MRKLSTKGLTLLQKAVIDELNKIWEDYDYDPNLKRDDDQISWKDFEGEHCLIQVTGDKIALLDWDNQNGSFKLITFQQFLELVHGKDSEVEPIPIPELKKSGNELMRELSHLMTFLNNMGYDTTVLTVNDTFEIKTLISNALLDGMNMRATEPIKDPFQ